MTKILNVGTLHPVLVLQGETSLNDIRILGGTLLGTFDSQVDTKQRSTWISFENMHKLNMAQTMINNGEI